LDAFTGKTTMKILLGFLLTLFSINCFSSNWECVSRTAFCHTWRMEVSGGWIVSGNSNESNYAMTFVPDAKHEWKV
jgi:hypothetical protein